ncbi:DUF6710 family protein [Staphylococcus nepalensis]|uniref:DUF6710 family protein n=1 Tax=Staphylococcus TaxID=1279 RepID=UPI002DBF4A4A|nr:DUF6710 family protein [Staphylococcus pseudoxylosus]MEB6038182.1 hypothetical protein [Staphylococcus pseudoxylosus]
MKTGYVLKNENGKYYGYDNTFGIDNVYDENIVVFPEIPESSRLKKKMEKFYDGEFVNRNLGHNYKTKSDKEKLDNTLHYIKRALDEEKMDSGRDDKIEFNNGGKYRQYNLEHSIFYIIKVFTDSLQYSNNVKVIRGDSANALDTFSDFLNEAVKSKGFESITRCLKEKFTVYNSKSPILTKIWGDEKIIGSIMRIGMNVEDIETGNKRGFEQESNHRSWYVYPMGITWVYNGNHSINAGMVKSEGSFTVDGVLDISETYDRYFFDGSKLINSENGNSRKMDFELGVLYEIGRIMMNHDELFDTKVIEAVNNEEPYYN